MANGTIGINAAVQLAQAEGGLTISIPGEGGSPVVGSVTIPGTPGGLPVDLNFSQGLVVSFPGTSVGSVTFPGPPGSPPFELPIPEAGVGLVDLPQGGHLVVTIPGGPTREKIKVTLKAGNGARLFTEAAAM